MEAIGIMHIRMREPGATSRQDTRLITADVILDQATIFVVLKEHDGAWPFTVHNKSRHEIAFGQIVCTSPRDYYASLNSASQDDDRERPEPELVYRVRPGERMPYAWDYPAVERKKLYISCNKRSRKIDIMEIGVLPPLKVCSTQV